MADYFRISKRLPKYQPGKHRQRVCARPAKGFSYGKLVLGQKALSATLLILLGVMGFMYMMFVNVRVTKGFEIKSLEKRIAELQKSQKQLERDSANFQSIQRIQQEVNISDFIPTTNVSYIQETPVALSPSNSGQ